LLFLGGLTARADDWLEGIEEDNYPTEEVSIEAGAEGATAEPEDGRGESQDSSEPATTIVSGKERVVIESPPVEEGGRSSTEEFQESETEVQEENSPPTGPTVAELLLQVDRQNFDIPVSYNPEVIAWVEWFLGPGRGALSSWMSRSTIYRDLIHRELIAARVPTEILYLAMIESGFNVHAESHAAAVGMWQFIEATGQRYGLRVDESIDERRHPVLATRAAAAYLKKLKNDFGNWHMAMAAYNAGEGLVFQSIRSSGSIDFWALAKDGSLPEETVDYVPKLIAAATISKYPELFGFSRVEPRPPLQMVSLEVNGGLLVSDLARSASLTELEFLEYNPQILTDALPVDPPKQVVWLPPDAMRDFYATLNRTPAHRSSEGRRVLVEAEPAVDLSHHVRGFTHIVQEGETVDEIAVNYGVNVARLRSLNGLTEADVLKVDQELTLRADQGGRWISHQVGRRESLRNIGQRYGCTQEEIRAWNGFEADTTLEVGKVLWLQDRR